MLKISDNENAKDRAEINRFNLKSVFILWNKNRIYYYSVKVFFVLLFYVIFTGVLLFLFYKNGSNFAFESVEYIVYKVKFGWLIHAVHNWAAQFVIISAFVHILIMLILNRYSEQNRFIFITFVLMFFILVLFAYTGSILPWNNKVLLTFNETTEILKNLPVIGSILTGILINSTDALNLDLSYIYKVHILILPFIFFLVFTVHLVLLLKQDLLKVNNSKISVESYVSKIPIYPDLILRFLLVFLVISNILFALSVLFPNPVNMKADYLFQTAPDILPAWYFIFIYQFGKIFEFLNLHEKSISYSIIVLFPFVLLLILPFLRNNLFNIYPGKPVKYAVIIVFFFIIFLTVYGYFKVNYY